MTIVRVRRVVPSRFNRLYYRFGSGSDVRVAGRVVLNVWRLLRSEVALYSYTFENTMFHVLHRRVPKYEHETLTQWWNGAHINKSDTFFL